MTSTVDDLRQRTLAQMQGALTLNIAYIGVVNDLFTTLDRLGSADAATLAKEAGQDPGYVARWCDAAYGFGLLDETAPGEFALTDLGSAFRPGVPGTLMPFAVQSVLSAHMAERAAGLMTSGERPGERVLAERDTILPWFGPMLEYQFGPLLDKEILTGVPVYQEVDRKAGLAVDLGCGNGWYLRRMAARYPGLRGVGLDGFEENILQARRLAKDLDDRVKFETGDIHRFSLDEPADLIAMNRALHHVWDEKENVFRILKEHLKPGGTAVIWEPAWPEQRSSLREPGRRPVAFQNLAEHIQGNHFLRPEEVAAQFEAVGMTPEIYLFADGREAVITGTR